MMLIHPSRVWPVLEGGRPGFVGQPDLEALDMVQGLWDEDDDFGEDTTWH